MVKGKGTAKSTSQILSETNKPNGPTSKMEQTYILRSARITRVPCVQCTVYIGTCLISMYEQSPFQN